ncbi:ecto-ADP-ribosyltransferase 5 isoform X1 [Hippoglossus stenolepis]|uniref:ecto-ADP-ribosyltransferase 5 isoform X1 n=2 Tax=Hippoglossus stenolepis TaxID=195615 RepID=UPI001FAEAA9C|nr:ecto-ADP-ribosyltransferase 5 isoform X1 [Hippoglossus stenolepis]XP_035021470.2 ecto-ADP-ribosyltransferase 5 isoform X1 [Hippoglossus stenolepis]
MTMMGVWAALLTTYGISIAFAKNSAELGLKGQPALDLAPNAVDDMYAGCRDKMETRVQKQYLANEKNKDKDFMLAWGVAEKYYNKQWKRKGKRPSTGLGREQIMALYVYSLDKPSVYLEFNDAVRTNRSVYMTTFKYHALHFFLTDALQTLSARKPEAERCLTGYRRVDSYFSQDVLNKLIRFGSFTSSSMGWYPSSERFGDKSCFEIVTCSGADISLYSKLGEAEREALIPPYEVFKVAKMERRSDLKSLPCEVVYKLKSTRKTLSRLNCSLFKNQQPHVFSVVRVKEPTKQ